MPRMHCIRVPSLGRALVPLKRFDLVDSDTFAIVVAESKVVIRLHVPSLCRALVALERFDLVDINTFDVRVALRSTRSIL